MKITILIPKNPFFENSAPANRWLTLIEGLSNLNVEINLLITGGYTSKVEYELMHNDGEINNVKYIYISNLFHDTIWKKRFNKYLFGPLLEHRSRNKIIKFIGTNTIVWSSYNLENLKLITHLKKKNISLKFFLELSEFLDIHKYNKVGGLQSLLENKQQAYFEKVAFSKLDGLALMTNTLYKHYLNFAQLNPKLLHLPMTVDFDRFSNKRINQSELILTELKQPYLLFVGAMNNQKDGLDILIDSFYLISNNFPNINLYLFGSYHYDIIGLLEKIEGYNLKDRVFYKGEVSRNIIPTILINSTLLVLPRPDSKQAQGGFPTKLGEYLASGKPVCATRVGEIPDYLIDNESVFFAKPGSVDSFADAISRSMNNPNQSIKVGLNGKKVAETYFNKDIQSKLLFDFLKQL